MNDAKPTSVTIPRPVELSLDDICKEKRLGMHVFVSKDRLMVFNLGDRGLHKVLDKTDSQGIKISWPSLKNTNNAIFWLIPGRDEEAEVLPWSELLCTEFYPIINLDFLFSGNYRRPHIKSWVPLYNDRDLFGHSWLFPEKSVYTLSCHYCGDKFETTDIRRKYCCDWCKRKNYTKRRKRINEKRHEALLNKRRCLNCGGLFEGRAGAKFCGDTCRQAHHRKSKKD